MDDIKLLNIEICQQPHKKQQTISQTRMVKSILDNGYG